jgi:predicted DNA-binding protein
MKEQLMKRTMIYLPEQTHEGLRKLAFEANTSIAELIRQAVDAIYSEDIEDIQDMEEELIKYLRQRKAHVSA